MTVTDATTIQRDNVIRNWGWVGNRGLTMSYGLSFILKKISDDPFYSVSEVTDVIAATTTEMGCFYEADGNYLATQDDQFVQDFRQEGTFYHSSAFGNSPMTSGVGSYSARFSLMDYSDYYSFFTRFTHIAGSVVMYETYNTDNNDTVIPARSITGNSARYSLNATNFANPSQTADIILDMN